MKIYTKIGDDGKTQLYGGARVSKDHIRIETYGTIDELSSILGMVRAAIDDGEIDRVLSEIQSDLFAIGAELASADPRKHKTDFLKEEHVKRLERQIDRFDDNLPALTTFILPAGSPGAANLHLARTVCRRAERRVVGLMQSEAVAKDLIPYLNRLSDLLFVLARVVNRQSGIDDVPWTRPDG